MIVGNVIGNNPITPKAYILETNTGERIPAVLVAEETLFTATKDDIREGKIAGTEKGVTTGEKVIPAYHTSAGIKVITSGKAFSIPNLDSNIDAYDYTQLQTIICAYNTSLSNSVSAEKVSIGDAVYNVNSTEALSTITKNHDAKSIDFGIVNESEGLCIIRFFTYKEIE